MEVAFKVALVFEQPINAVYEPIVLKYLVSNFLTSIDI